MDGAQVEGYFGLVGQSEAIGRVVGLLERVRRTELPVLLEGASGTGKDLVARLLHQQGPRAAGPYVALHCGAVPAGLVDSALFGHVRGAFTGAVEDRRGVFEAADGGTLYLDDLGALPREAQPRLLRVLADGQVQPVGSSGARVVDVRVIASLRDGDEARLRQDLFHRLATVRVRLPSLEARREDIVALVACFVRRHAGAGAGRRLSPETLRRLESARYPGEVRQLEAVVRAALLLSDGPLVDDGVVASLLEAHAVAAPAAGEGRAAASVRPLAVVEREAILHAVGYFEGNKKRAAEALGIDRSTLYAKLRAYGVGAEGGEG
jgi:DNA-binding NtrC family response regulator